MNRKQTLEWLKIKRLDREWLINAHRFWTKAELSLWGLKLAKFRN